MSEDQLVQTLTRNIPVFHRSLKVGVGDDGSVIRIGKKEIVISVDSLVEEIHFKKSWGPWHRWGEKLGGAALSDIAAMGGTPQYAWVTLALPTSMALGATKQFYQGLLKILKKWKTTVAGGNITASPEKFAAHLAVWGELPAGQAMLRSKARPKEMVYLAGILRKDFKRVYPQMEMGLWLRKQGCRCCIDLSDGLLKDLNHVAQASRVQILLDAGQIPFQGNFLQEAITCGENYNLAFTFPMGKKLKGAPEKITPIGVVRKGKPGVSLLGTNGKLLFFKKMGYDHPVVQKR